MCVIDKLRPLNPLSFFAWLSRNSFLQCWDLLPSLHLLVLPPLPPLAALQGYAHQSQLSVAHLLGPGPTADNRIISLMAANCVGKNVKQKTEMGLFSFSVLHCWSLKRRPCRYNGNGVQCKDYTFQSGRPSGPGQGSSGPRAQGDGL